MTDEIKLLPAEVVFEAAAFRSMAREVRHHEMELARNCNRLRRSSDHECHRQRCCRIALGSACLRVRLRLVLGACARVVSHREEALVKASDMFDRAKDLVEDTWTAYGERTFEYWTQNDRAFVLGQLLFFPIALATALAVAAITWAVTLANALLCMAVLLIVTPWRGPFVVTRLVTNNNRLYEANKELREDLAMVRESLDQERRRNNHVSPGVGVRPQVRK